MKYLVKTYISKKVCFEKTAGNLTVASEIALNDLSKGFEANPDDRGIVIRYPASVVLKVVIEVVPEAESA